MLERAVAIWEHQPRPDFPSLASGLVNLGLFYTDTGKLAPAEKCFERAMQIASQSLPPDHPNLAAYKTDYALLLRKLGRRDDARKLEESAKLSRQNYARRNLLGYTVDTRQLKPPEP